MKHYRGYLIDLDGTMYRGNEKIEAAPRFICALQEKQIPYLFVTNNASLTPEVIAEKLQGFDIPARTEDVFSSALATAQFIKQQNSKASCFVVGEAGLVTAMHQEGIRMVDRDADYVVMGLDRKITYDKLASAALEIQQGATFISTNRDMAIPREHGFYPGNGALTEVVAKCAGVDPIYIGKPENIIMEEAIRRLGVASEHVMMVGDNYQTDIQAGIQAGLDTLMVLTGVTRPEHIKDLPVKPTHYVTDLDEWIPNL